MWFLLKSTVGLFLLVLLAWCAFFVNLGDRPLADHILDVWGSAVVQEKVDLVADGVKRGIEDRIATAAEEGAREATHEVLDDGRPRAEFDRDDTAALETLLGE